MCVAAHVLAMTAPPRLLSELALGSYLPTGVEVAITAACFAGVLLLYALFRLEYVCLSTKRSLSVVRSMDRPPVAGSWAEWTLQVVANLLALTNFILIYRTRLRTLLSAPAILVEGGLLTMRLLRDPASDWRRGGICALVIGLILGEATWALNYWPGRSIVGGVLLFLVFYVFIGLARRGVEDRLTLSALLEYGIVALLGLGLLVRFS